ncbi:MAG: NfeD family protein, partial [Alphaproteobacteria bacterium]|nr:NfeD family protein [Alphaproteobacteria bacterium]
PGVVGGISIILAFFAFQTLPVNYAGILLILLALIFFILEIKIISHGMLSIAGIASLLLGSLMLFEAPGPQVALKVMIPTVALVSGFFVGVIALGLRSQLVQPRTGAEALVGKIGLAKTDIALEGRVAIHGELWNASSKEPIRAGNRVKVKKVVDLTLEVEAFFDE